MVGFTTDLCVVKHISGKFSKADIQCQQCRQESEAVNSPNLLQDTKGRSGSADKSQGLLQNPSQMSQAINSQRGQLRIILSGVSCTAVSYCCCSITSLQSQGAEQILWASSHRTTPGVKLSRYPLRGCSAFRHMVLILKMLQGSPEQKAR